MSLPSPISVNPQARDIIFTCPESCNCCFPRRDPRLYVNSQGRVERYRVRKANGSPDQAFDRAIKHLNLTMARRIIAFEGDPDVFERKVDRVFQSIHALQEINRSHIERINELMIEYFKEQQNGGRHVTYEDQQIHPAMLVQEPAEAQASRCLIL